MDLNKGFPLKKQQNFEVQQPCVPTMPARATSASSQRSQTPRPSWLEPTVMLANCELPCQSRSSSSSSIHNHLRESHHEAMLPSLSHASTGSIIMLHTPTTSSGSVNSLDCWSPLMSKSLDAAYNVTGTSKMPLCPPLLVQIDSRQEMPSTQNMFLLKGKVFLAAKPSNSRSSCCSTHKAEYRLPVTSIPNCDSLPESTMNVSRNILVSAPPTPATTEKINKRMQDKNPHSVVSQFVEEGETGENLMATEVISYQTKLERLSGKNISVLYEGTFDHLIGVEKTNTGRETKEIELNGTPKKRLQRKKHRPKVFKEGKRSRTTKPVTPMSDIDEKNRLKDNTTSKRKYVWRNKDVPQFLDNENTSCKRKYVRRHKDVTYSLDTATNALGEIVDTKSKGKSKSPRRCLNFNLKEPQSSEEFSVAMSVFKKVLGVHGRDECDEGAARSMRMKEAVHSTRIQDQMAVKPSTESASDPNISTYHSYNEFLQQILIPTSEVNRNICALDKEKPPLKSSINHFKAVAREVTCFDLTPLKSSSEFSPDILNPNGNSDAPPKGIKRCHLYTDEADVSDQKRITHSYNHQGFSSKSCNVERQNSCLTGIHKTIRMEKGGQSDANPIFPSSMLCTNSNSWKMRQLSDNSLELTFTDAERFRAQEKVPTSKCILSLDQTEEHVIKNPSLDGGQIYLSSTGSCSRKSTSVKQSRKNKDIFEPSTPEKLSKFRGTSKNKICENQALESSEDINKYSKQDQCHPLYAMSSCTKHAYAEVREETDSNGGSPAYEIAEIGSLATRGLNGKNLIQGTISIDCQTISYFNISAYKSFASRTLVPFIDPVDYIVQKLRQLNICRCHQFANYHPQNAIVPYSSNEFMIVPCDKNFELTRKRRPRAKVDLDPESNRVWKLLMGKDCDKGGEQPDMDKEKWWNEERRVFQGRVDSFISRMHLVQGDRRFSQWKGSVVDSVVGVFLTQNVSDHLSSFAFMSLAANFPLRSRSKCSIPLVDVKTSMEIQNRCNISLTDSHKLQRNLFGNGSFQNPLELGVSQNGDQKETSNCSEPLGSITGNSITYYSRKKGKGKRSELCKKEVFFCQKPTVDGSNINLAEVEDIIRLSEDAVTSYDSVLSSQNTVGFNPSLNIEADDLLSGSMSNALGSSSFTKLLQMAERSGLKEVYNHVGGMISETENQVSILNIQNNTSVMSQLDTSKDTFQSCNANSILHHAALSLSDMLLPTKSSISDDLISSKIMVNDINLSKEKISSHLLPINCEINSDDYFEFMSRKWGESEGSVTESTSPHKVLSSSRAATSIDSISKQTTHKTLSEMEIRGNTLDSSKNENPHACVSLDTEVPERLQQEDEISIIKAQRTRDEALDKPCRNQQVTISNNEKEEISGMPNKFGLSLHTETCSFLKISPEMPNSEIKIRKSRPEVERSTYDWESLRKEVCCSKPAQERSSITMDSLDWEAVRTADVSKIAETIRKRGMNNVLAERIKEFLNRLIRDHGSIDLEWLRDLPPDKAKDYLLSIRGLGLKSAECVRLLTLQQLAFPVDTNVGRICVRLGWVPLQPLPESLQLHLLELYPVLASIQKYLWPRLCKLDQRTLYELHYQMITFGKVFCTKSKPNCNSCPMRGECRHFASAFASARLALPAPEEKSVVNLNIPIASGKSHALFTNPRSFPQIEGSSHSQDCTSQNNCVPVIEEPASPEPECQEILESAIEDAFYEDPDEIPSIKLSFKEFTQNLQNYMEENMVLQDGSLSKALVALTPEAASIPMPKLKNVSRLRTEHHVYEIPDRHPLLEGLDPREPDDPSPYLLAIWTPGETALSTEPPKASCNMQDVDQPCESTCFTCNSIQTESHKVRGTLLIPCRTAMRGSFPLNGTYFQVNEVFADHHSSFDPIYIPRDWIWNLPRRTVFFGTSIPTIFRGLTTEGIQQCFWRGFVCVKGFDRVTRAPKPLYARLHFPASKASKRKNTGEQKSEK